MFASIYFDCELPEELKEFQDKEFQESGWDCLSSPYTVTKDKRLMVEFKNGVLINFLSVGIFVRNAESVFYTFAEYTGEKNEKN